MTGLPRAAALSIRAVVGDNALVEDAAAGELRLLSSRGALASWKTESIGSYAALPSPPRLAFATGGAVELIDVVTGAVERRIAAPNVVERTDRAR